MPQHSVPYDVFVVRLIEAYYAAGATEKANELAKIMTSLHGDKARYYMSFKKKRNAVSQEIEDNVQIMTYISQIVDMNGQAELAKELRSEIDKVTTGMVN
jgi:hypothetical protein